MVKWLLNRKIKNPLSCHGEYGFGDKNKQQKTSHVPHNKLNYKLY